MPAIRRGCSRRQRWRLARTSHFASRIGLNNAKGITFPSPYALDENGLIYLPAGSAQPSDAEHTAAVMEAVLLPLKFTSGGMFCLFTSHRALNNARKWLQVAQKEPVGAQVARTGRFAA